MLIKAVESYLAVRRAAGFKLKCQEYLLRRFARFASERGDLHIRTDSVMEWASQVKVPRYRLEIIAPFARYLHAEDERHEVSPSQLFGRRRSRRIPFIFSQDELNRLIQAATRLQPLDSLRPHTYATLFALLAVSGLRISEALNLRFDDVTADGLFIRKTKFQKSRLVPLHETAVAGLERYLERRKRTAATDDHVFVSLLGRRLSRNAIAEAFDKLLKTTGLDRGRAGRRPRIHDLRFSFAVRALETCPEGRDNVGRHMLALSTYMGHTEFRYTYWYLQATPHLMRDIAESCDAFMKGGAP
jgi:integrase